MARFAVSVVTCRQAEMRMPLSGWFLMKSLRILCRTGMDWLAHSMRRFPRSARSILLISDGVCVSADVDMFSCLHALVGPRTDSWSGHCYQRRAVASLRLPDSAVPRLYIEFIYFAAPTLVFDPAPSPCSLNLAALSVASKVKSGSLRPKCP